MRNTALPKALQQFYTAKVAAIRDAPFKSGRCLRRTAPTPTFQLASGFTLFELLFVLIIVGILSAIAAPSWIAFTNGQRVNVANEAVLRVLQEAQREAKRRKLSYSVSFISIQDQPKVVIYPAGATPDSSDRRWTNLGGDIALKPGQVLLYTNIGTPNQVNIDASEPSLATTAKTITFDYTGALPLGADTRLKVVVAEAKPGTSLAPNVVKRCVIVETLIGGMRTAKGTNCN